VAAAIGEWGVEEWFTARMQMMRGIVGFRMLRRADALRECVRDNRRRGSHATTETTTIQRCQRAPRQCLLCRMVLERGLCCA
jgi:hypothetical protein